METIREHLQESCNEVDDYVLKTDDEIIDIIIQFGLGETEFHTADIERLIREKRALEKIVENAKDCYEYDGHLLNFDAGKLINPFKHEW